MWRFQKKSGRQKRLIKYVHLYVRPVAAHQKKETVECESGTQKGRMCDTHDVTSLHNTMKWRDKTHDNLIAFAHLVYFVIKNIKHTHTYFIRFFSVLSFVGWMLPISIHLRKQKIDKQSWACWGLCSQRLSLFWSHLFQKPVGLDNLSFVFHCSYHRHIFSETTDKSYFFSLNKNVQTTDIISYRIVYYRRRHGRRKRCEIRY